MKKIKIDRTPTRRDDERLLCWLQMRDAGMATRQIGEAWGVTKNSVIGALNRVIKEEVE